MADLNRIRVRDCELSVRTCNTLTNHFGADVTLGDLSDLALLGRLLTRKGVKEIQEVIENAKAAPAPNTLIREAQQWKMEALAHKSSLHEAYQAVTQGRGEPGNWNGAQPIIQELERLRRGRDRMIELLHVAADFIHENDLEGLEIEYDGVVCDGECLRGDIKSILEQLDE
jgi:hypothetical protein